MILVPELELVVLLVPRTGSGALYRAVLKRYPRATMLYRHMEADGMPQGYDRWPKIGVVRDPVERLWSLFKFQWNMPETAGETGGGQRYLGFVDRMQLSVRRYGDVWDCAFSHWLLDNDVPFTHGVDGTGGKFHPLFTCRCPIAENRKSQFIYLRPDLGTQVWRYQDYAGLAHELDVRPSPVHATPSSPPPELTSEARAYMERMFAWDFAASR